AFDSATALWRVRLAGGSIAAAAAEQLEVLGQNEDGDDLDGEELSDSELLVESSEHFDAKE
ncbi:unnamed protein product, partial [Symbiodinium sp. KB8]